MGYQARPFAFIRLGERWINLVMVTDIIDREADITIYLAADMARRISRDSDVALDVARQVTLTDPEQMSKLRKWLKLNDVD